MKKIFTFVFIALLGIQFGFAQDEEAEKEKTEEEEKKPWTKGGMGTITYNQVGLFNWAAGGNSNMTLIGNLNVFANYKGESSTWDNSLDLAYGFIQNFQPNTIGAKVPGSRITKAEDKIELTSKYGTKAWNEKFSYSALLNFRTQFAPGFSSPLETSPLSRFLSPAYLQLAIGLTYKPNKHFEMFLSPVSGKLTVVADDSLASTSAFGVNQRNDNGDFLPGNSESVRMEFGATFTAKFKKDIMKNVGLESNLNMFSNYIDRPQNIDVRWTNALVAKVNKYITVNLFTDLIYDHDIKIPLYDGMGAPILGQDGTQRKEPRTQFKEVFGVGFAYKF